MITYTYTRLMSWLDCPMREFYEFQAGGHGIKSAMPYEPFIEGELGHYAIAMWRKSGRMLKVNMIKRVEKILDDLRKGAGAEPELIDSLEKKLAAMVGATQAYKMHYKADLEDHEWKAIEEEAEVQIGNSTVLMKMDAISTRKKDKRLILWENKFVSSATNAAATYALLPMNLQTTLYCEGCKQLLGKYPDFIQFDYTFKSALRLKKDESVEAFHDRVRDQYLEDPGKKFFRPPSIPFDPNVLDRVKTAVRKQVAQMQGTIPNFNFGSCAGKYGKPCQFAPACTARLAGKSVEGWDSAMCAGLYKKKTKTHPELKGGK
jgi:hypothetical protein